MKIENNAVSVYSLENGALQQVINSGFVITSNTLYDAKFSRAPISAGSSIYNIILLGAKLRSSTVDVTTGVARFDTKNPTVVKEYFACNTTNGGDNGGRFGSYGFTIVENDNYVYSTIKCYSNYYKSWTGNNELLYINNDAKTITRRCEFGGIGAAGLVPQMTDDHRIILVNCPNHLQLSRVNDNNSGITAITSYTPSATNPRLVLTDAGYFYLDKGYYNTNRELLHLYTSLPWEYNDVVLWCNGYLVRFNNTSTVRVYSFNKDTFEIKMEKSFETNGVPNLKYYNTGVSNHYAMTVNDYPEANGNTIAFSTANGVYYVLYLDVENLRLDSVEIKGIGYYNTSSVDTAADRLLTGNTMFTSEGVVKGTMPDNGELIYTPTESTQTIPKGYTSGGVINPAVFEDMSAYADCLTLTQHILTENACPFVRVDYLQAYDGPYIQTGIPLLNTTNWKIELDIQLLETNYNYNGIWGVSSSTTAYECWVAQDSASFSRYNGTKPSAMTVNTSRMIFVDEYNNGKLTTYINGTSKRSYSVSSAITSDTLNLLRCSGSNSRARLYGAKLYQNDELVADYVPVVDYAGYGALYDNISKKLIYGTSGKFTLGDIIG